MSRRSIIASITITLSAVPATASAAVLTTGTLTNELGANTAGQVRVYAFAVPRGGGVTESPQLGVGQAGPDGQFTVTAADDGQLLELAGERGGWIDLTAVADTPGRQAQWGFTVFVDAPADAARVSSTDAVTTGRGVASTASSTSAPRIKLRADRPVPFAQAAQAGTCDTKLRTRKPQSVRKLAVVGEINNAYNDGTWGQFTYARENSAETSFGIAANYEGSTWTISGENLITTKGSAKFPKMAKRASRKLRTLFEFTRYQVQRSSCAVWETEIRATSWIGGTDSTTKQRGLDKCDPRQVFRGFEGGADFHRENAAAVRYTRAVEAFGVNLTSRTNFSRNVTLDYLFGGHISKQHYLCGPDGKQSPYESGRVFSGARR